VVPDKLPKGNDMNKRTLILIILMLVIVVVILITFIAPYAYVASENKNFEKLRKKTLLNCSAMPLHCLIRDEDVQGVQVYIESDENLEIKDNWGKSALFWSVTNQKTTTITLLLEAGANARTQDNDGNRLLLMTILSGLYELADQLIINGANVDDFNGNKNRETLLHYCVMKNKFDCVAYLMDKGASTSLKDSFGYTVLDRIKTHGHISDAIKNLLSNKT